MICPQCRHDNPAGNRFCGSCGTRLQTSTSEVKVDPKAPSVMWLKGAEERRAESSKEEAARAEAERAAQREREIAERAKRAAIRERELAALREREAIDRAVNRNASIPAVTESQPRRSAVAGPSFLGLSEGYEPEPLESSKDSADYEPNDIYGGRSYSRALWLLIILLVVAGLVFMQWRYSNSLQASRTGEKPSAVEPTESNPANTEAEREAEMAKNNEAAGAKPESDESAATQGQEAAKQDEKTAASTSEPQVKSGETKQQAGKSAKQEKKSTAAQQETTASEAESESEAQTAQATDGEQQPGQPARKPPARVRATSEQVAEDSDQPVRLAETYLLGRGTPQNCDRGVEILRDAANRGNYRAQIKLGALYATGNCVSLDRVQAYRFFTRALQAKPNNTWVEHNRSMLWAHMDEQERQQAIEHSF